MKVTIASPTKAFLSEYSDDDLSSLKKQLTYTNTGIQHLIKRHYSSHFWKSRNPDTWGEKLKELQTSLKKCLVFEEDGKYYIRPGSIPYLSGFDLEVINEVQYPSLKKMPWKNPFNFELHPYQEESWKKLIAEKHGAVSLCTGSGKSAIILKLLKELGLQAVVVVPSASIFNEILEKMELHFGKKIVGGYGDGKKCIGRKFTIAISDSLVNLKEGTEAYDFFKKQQVFVADECFPSRTPIITEHGIKEIHAIHKDIMLGKIVKVLSFNESTKIFEYKKVTNSWKRLPKNILRQIKASGMVLRCTEDHKLLTQKGWKFAKNITTDDHLIGYRGLGKRSSIANKLNSDQEQIVLGSYLGDGNLAKHKNGFRVRIIHGEKQERYLRWKAYMFNKNFVENIEKNGYSGKRAFRFSTYLFYSDIAFSSKKGNDLELVLNRLDERGIAVWIMDDGSKDPNGSTLTIHTESLTYEQHVIIQNYFIKRWKLSPKILSYNRKDKTYYYTRFSVKDSLILHEMISPYIHENIEYKVIKSSAPNYVWNNTPLEEGTVKVLENVPFSTEQGKIYGNKKYSYDLYDLEVEDNHNFVVGNGSGIVAHNCHTLPSETLEEVCHGVLDEVPYRFYLSGTQSRGDGTLKLLQSITGAIVRELTTQEAIIGGYICPHEFRIVSLESSNPSDEQSDPLAQKRTHFLNNTNIAQFTAKLANAMATTHGKQTLVLCEELSQLAMLVPLLKVPYALAHSEKRSERLKELGLEKVDVSESVEKFNKNEAKVLITTSCCHTGVNIFPTHSTVNWIGGASEIKTKQAAIGRSVRFGHSNPWASKCVPKEKSVIYDFNIIDNFTMNRHLEARIACYLESGPNLISYVRLKPSP